MANADRRSRFRLRLEEIESRLTPAYLVIGQVEAIASTSVAGANTATSFGSMSYNGNFWSTESPLASNAASTANATVNFYNDGVFRADNPLTSTLGQSVKVSHLVSGTSDKATEAVTASAATTFHLRIAADDPSEIGKQITFVMTSTLSQRAGELVQSTIRYSGDGLSGQVVPDGNLTTNEFTGMVGSEWTIETSLGGMSQANRSGTRSVLSLTSMEVGFSFRQYNLRMIDVRWNTDRSLQSKELYRGLDFKYAVEGGDVPESVSARFYYSRSDTYSTNDSLNIIRFAGERQLSGKQGMSDWVNEPARWATPPADAKYIIIVLDEDNVIPEASDPRVGVAEDNVIALRLHSAEEILVPSAISQISSGSLTLTAEFHPGQNLLSSDPDLRAGLTISEAEVVLGVDHFNWLQQFVGLPPGWSMFREYNDEPLAMIDLSQRLATFDLPPYTSGLLKLPVIDPAYQWAPDSNGRRLTSEGYLINPEKARYNISLDTDGLDNYPFYWQEDAPSASRLNVGSYKQYTSSRALLFSDTPFISDSRLSGDFFHGSQISFQTQLVGVSTTHTQVPLPRLLGFTWTSDGYTTDGLGAYLNPRPGGSANFTGVTVTKSLVQQRVTAHFGDGADLQLEESLPGPSNGIHATSADYSNDGVADLAIGTGTGIAPTVVVFDGFTRSESVRLQPFEREFLGGVYLASADIDSDGVPDLLVGAGEGGGPRVQIYSGKDFRKIADFFGYDDPDSRVGARVSISDITGDGRPDLIVAAGHGGGPRVSIWDGVSFSPSAGLFTRKVVDDFFVFEPDSRIGAYIASADLDGDGHADLICGAGDGGAPRVRVISGGSILLPAHEVILDFFAGDSSERSGVQVATIDRDGDGIPDLKVITGTAKTLQSSIFLGVSLLTNRTPTRDDTYMPSDSDEVDILLN